MVNFLKCTGIGLIPVILGILLFAVAGASKMLLILLLLSMVAIIVLMCYLLGEMIMELIE